MQNENETTENILSGGDPEMEQRLRDGAEGRYEHTLLQIWEQQLANELEGWAAQSSMDTYDQFLRSWTWIGYTDIPAIRRHLLKLTQEAMDGFDNGIQKILSKYEGRTKETVYADAENDWEDNGEIYFEVVAQWSALLHSWGVRWSYLVVREQPRFHVAVAIMAGRLVAQNGLVEQMKHLAGFTATDETQQKLQDRVGEIVAEMYGPIPEEYRNDEDTVGESDE